LASVVGGCGGVVVRARRVVLAVHFHLGPITGTVGSDIGEGPVGRTRRKICIETRRVPKGPGCEVAGWVGELVGETAEIDQQRPIGRRARTDVCAVAKTTTCGTGRSTEIVCVSTGPPTATTARAPQSTGPLSLILITRTAAVITRNNDELRRGRYDVGKSKSAKRFVSDNSVPLS
jgi:hypothetical protein